MSPWVWMAVAAATVALLTACTSMRTQDNWHQSVRAGDQVRVWKQPSGMIDLTVTAVSADAIEGTVGSSTELQRIEAGEIRRVEKRQVDGVKIVKGVGIGLYAVLTALFAAFLIVFG